MKNTIEMFSIHLEKDNNILNWMLSHSFYSKWNLSRFLAFNVVSWCLQSIQIIKNPVWIEINIVIWSPQLSFFTKLFFQSRIAKMSFDKIRGNHNEYLYEGAKRHILNVMDKMFEKRSQTADVHFAFEENGTQIRIPAHTNVLAIGSSVFEEMFFGPNKHFISGDIPTKSVTISALTFDAFITLFYGKKWLQWVLCQMLQVYRFNTTIITMNFSLMSIVGKWKSITIENYVDLLRLSENFGAKYCEEACQQFKMIYILDSATEEIDRWKKLIKK